LGFDQIGKEKYASDNLRIEMIKMLIAKGHVDQIMLSGDLARKSYWPSFGFGNGPGLTYILWRFVSRMIEEGIDRAIVHRLLVENPARFLAWVEKIAQTTMDRLAAYNAIQETRLVPLFLYTSGLRGY
jgi:predicted metal-dependent phosphotriesterase family hydrolase